MILASPLLAFKLWIPQIQSKSEGNYSGLLPTYLQLVRQLPQSIILIEVFMKKKKMKRRRSVHNWKLHYKKELLKKIFFKNCGTMLYIWKMYGFQFQYIYEENFDTFLPKMERKCKYCFFVLIFQKLNSYNTEKKIDIINLLHPFYSTVC